MVLIDTPDRPIAVPLDQAEKSGLKHDQVKINEKYGGGFIANVEGLHHLHCLVNPPASVPSWTKIVPNTTSHAEPRPKIAVV